VDLTERLRDILAERRVRWLLVAALIGLYSGWIVYEIQRDRLYDFNTYYIAADAFGDGIDVYALAVDYAGVNQARWDELAAQLGIRYHAPPYRYPPLTAQLVLPLTRLPPLVAGTVWMVLTAVSYGLSAWLLGRSAGTAHAQSLALALLLAFVPPLTTLHAGQVNGLLLLALCASLYGLSAGKWASAGLGAAAGALLKLIPIAIVLYLPWRRLWRAAGVAVGAILVLLLLSPLVLGAGTLRSYGRSFFAIGQPGTVFTTGANQSLNGFWGRTLERWWDDGSVYRLYLASAAVIVLGTVACLWPPVRRPSYHRQEFALVVCALQLITPYTWYHQLVLLLVPFFTLLSEILARRAPRAWLAPLAVAFVATDVHGLAWHHIPVGALLSMPFYTTLMLYAMLAWLILRERRRVYGGSATT
jgi:hypothetical protein